MQRVSFKYFIRQSPIWQLLTIALVVCAASVCLVAFTAHPTDRSVILHYSIPLGIDLLGPWQALWWYPGIALGIFVVNLIIGYLTYAENRVLTVCLYTFTIMAQCITFIGLALLIMQNRS